MGSFHRVTKPALWQPPQRAKNWAWAARPDRLELSRKEGEGKWGSGTGFSLQDASAALLATQGGLSYPRPTSHGVCMELRPPSQGSKCLKGWTEPSLLSLNHLHPHNTAVSLRPSPGLDTPVSTQEQPPA